MKNLLLALALAALALPAAGQVMKQQPSGQMPMLPPSTQSLAQRRLPPDIVSLNEGVVARKYVASGLFVRFSGLTPDREARITGIRPFDPHQCRFARAEGVTLPQPVTPTQDGKPPVTLSGIPGTFLGWPSLSEMQCKFEIGYDWREAGGAWQAKTVMRTLAIAPHEEVTVTDTWRLRSWLNATGEPGLGACGNGIKSHNGKLAFEVTATALGADCPFTVMSTRGKTTVSQFNMLAEGVVLNTMRWTVEKQGSACCLGSSKNEACASLPTPPVQYAFEVMAAMSPEITSGDRYAIFSNKKEIMTGQQIIIGWNPEQRWRTAFMNTYGRLSCSAVNPMTETYTTTGNALCDAACSALSNVGLQGLLPSGTGIKNGGTLSFTDSSQSQCRISGGPFNGQCQAQTGCPPGQESFTENGARKCRTKTLTPTPMPWIRVVLDSVTVRRPPGTALPF